MTVYPIKDALDRRICGIVCRNPGIRLSGLSQELGFCLVTVRYRVLDLEREGILRVEKGRNSVKVYPMLDDEAAAGDI